MVVFDENGGEFSDEQRALGMDRWAIDNAEDFVALTVGHLGFSAEREGGRRRSSSQLWKNGAEMQRVGTAKFKHVGVKFSKITAHGDSEPGNVGIIWCCESGESSDSYKRGIWSL